MQVIREWTKANHFAIHDLTLAAAGGLRARERFWNEHNFVFRRGDSFLHGKGATPAWADFAEDSSGLVLIPLNMAEPILIAHGVLDRTAHPDDARAIAAEVGSPERELLWLERSGHVVPVDRGGPRLVEAVVAHLSRLA